MSQKKVDAYKNEKKNRKENLKKQKVKRKINLAVGILVAVLFFGGIGYWFYYSAFINPEKPAKTEDEITQEIMDILNSTSANSLSGNTVSFNTISSDNAN